jgi:regulatory protein YycH of two-component signal transduction system YycFG
MIHKKIKNIVLFVMVIVCVYLSSYVWLQLPDFISSADTEGNVPDEIIVADIWEVVRPIKNIIKYKDNYTVTYSDKSDMWGKTVHIINDAFQNYDKSSVTESAAFPSEYLKFDFSTNIPSEIFTGHMQIENAEISNTVKNIKNVIVDLENTNSLYFYDGYNTVKIEGDSIDTSGLLNIINNFDFESETKYSFDQKIGEETVQVPVPLEVSALNPVFVQSELDVFDTYRINEIAKDYFKNNYDYVRKSVEVSGNLVYTYRTEKVLKINEEGLLDFYDAAFDPSSVTDQYESFAAAVNFTEEFLGFPKDVYLSNLEGIQHEGNYGYRYTFSYKILERPILFSKVRENTALQIDVVGNKVVSYKRFIRNIDDSQMDKMNNTQILPAVEVISRNLDTGENGTAEDTVSEIKPIKIEMIKDINNIYLGYFDLARISKEQMLRVVWVIETNDKSYIFNATTGALIEEW